MSNAPERARVDAGPSAGPRAARRSCSAGEPAERVCSADKAAVSTLAARLPPFRIEASVSVTTPETPPTDEKEQGPGTAAGPAVGLADARGRSMLVATLWQHSALERLQVVPPCGLRAGRPRRAFREQTQTIASPKSCS